MSTTSPTDVCNLALALVSGIAGANVERLVSLDADAEDESANKALGFCQAFYPIASELVLNELGGPRTTKYLDPGAALATASEETNPGWEYCFTRPSNAVSIIAVGEEDTHLEDGSWTTFPYEEVNGQILCDYDDILVKAVVMVADTTQWIAHVVYAVAARLAVMLAVPMGLSPEQAITITKQSELAINKARVAIQSQVYVPEQTIFDDLEELRSQ